MEKWTRLLLITTTLLLLLVFVGTVIHLATYIHHTLLLFALGALLAYALDPLVEKLRHTRLTKSGRVPSREFSVTVVYVVFFIFVGLAAWSLEGRFSKEIATMQQDYPQYHTRALELAAQADVKLQRVGVHCSLTNTIQHPPADIQSVLSRAGEQALPLVEHLFVNIGESVIVALISLYFLLFCTEMREKFNAMFSEPIRERIDLWETDVNRIFGGFVRGQLIIALLVGALAALGCLLIGIHVWLLIGLFVVVAALIPVFGPYLGAVPAVIAALVGKTHFGPVVSAVLIAVYFVIINEVGSKVLYPKLVGAALGLHAVLVLFVLFAGLELGGVVGVLFAAPVTALIIVSLTHLVRFWKDMPDTLVTDGMERPGKMKV